MKRFLPVIVAFAFTTLAVGVALFVLRPGIRTIQTRSVEIRHKLADVIDEITDQEEGER